MIWVKADEEKFYSNNVLKELLKKMGVIFTDFTPVYLPSGIEDIKKAVNGKKVIVSPKYPSDFGYDDYGFFTLIETDNDYGLLTSEQKELGIKEEKVLSEKLGLKVYAPKATFKDMAGAEKLLSDTENMIEIEHLGRPIGGLFLFGVPGTGKSYFAECFAGQTGRHLVEMDLSFIINTPNPTRTIDKIFDFLYSKDNMRFVLWIDEIEKMYDMQNLKAKQVFGKLLTKLNEVAKEELSHIVFVATANNITDIMRNNPEFLRKGRFRKLYFLNFPKEDDALSIIKFYVDRGRKKFESRLLKVLSELRIDRNKLLYFMKKGNGIFGECADFVRDSSNRITKENPQFQALVNKYYISLTPMEMYNMIDTYYPFKQVKKRFIYTPSEIKVFIDELIDMKKISGNKKSEKEIVKAILKEVVPIQISMKDAISAMVSQSKNAYDLDSKIFVEV